jgi:ParB/RepB/Spo0J family partition protein
MQLLREKRRLGELIDFPEQAKYFPPLSADDSASLADDIKRNGLRCPIEILPENEAGFPAQTIIKGHERRLALQALGKKYATVIVRVDLATASKTAIEQEFLEDNVNRRQLHPLDKARAAHRLLEIDESATKPHADLSVERPRLRERIGKAIGVSGRMVSRYIRVLSTPPEVQDAVRDGHITMVLADKVAGLDKKAQRVIASELRSRDDSASPKRIVQSHLRPDGRPPRSSKPSRPAFKTILADLIDVGDAAGVDEVRGHGPRIRQAIALLERLSLLAGRAESTKAARRRHRSILADLDAPYV